MFSNKFCSSGALSVSNFIDFWNKIRLILDQLWHPRSCIPQEASRQPQNCFKLAYMSQSGPNLDPSWLQVVSSWVHVGPKLAPTWLKLGSCWVHFWVPSRPWANPRLSKPLPCGLLASQTPTRSKMEFKRTSQTSNLDLKPPQNTPKLNLKASLPSPQLLLAHCYYYCYSRTGGMGRSLLEQYIEYSIVYSIQ